MRSHIHIGRFFGISVGLHYTWLLIAMMIALSLAGHFEATHPDWAAAVIWSSALLTAVLFFVTLVLHEMAHSLVAKAQGLPVKAITLFALGGVAQIEGEPASAKAELLMALAGPFASAVIGSACLGTAAVLGWSPLGQPDDPVIAVLVWLGFINWSLAVFNMIPGFPLDGGRVLRALAWWITGDPHRSLRLATRVGRVVAVGFMIAGLVRFAAGAGFGGLWIAFIGWFLFGAAGSSYVHDRISELLTGVLVKDLMVRDCPRVDGWTNLQAFLDENRLAGSRFCYIVTHGDQIAGLMSSLEVQQVPEPQRRFKTVTDVMRPLEDTPSISPDAPITEALEAMGREEVNQLPVTADGHMEGVISRANVLRFLEAHGRLRG